MHKNKFLAPTLLKMGMCVVDQNSYTEQILNLGLANLAQAYMGC